MSIEVTSVEALDGYRLRVGFSDGLIGEVDLAPHLFGEMFEPLKDLGMFRRVFVDSELGTVAWPNEADLAVEFLHAEAVKAPLNAGAAAASTVQRRS